MSAPHPGRNALGQFTTDDTTAKQVFENQQKALRLLVDHMRDPAMDGVTRLLWADLAAGYLDEADAGLKALDTGRRPKQESGDV